MLEVLKKKNDALKGIEDQIIEQLTNEVDIGRIIEESTDFELITEEKIVLLEEMLGKHFTTKTAESEQASLSSSSKSTTKETHAVRLPKLEIAKFNGESTRWQTFIDSFTATIGSSKNLSNIEKFNYLRCYLTGDAL